MNTQINSLKIMGRSFAGWLAGVEQGNIVVANPQSGETNVLVKSQSVWHGPISDLVWSPDHSKIAYIAMPANYADGFNQNKDAQANALGLESVPTPKAFPFGQIIIIDVATKQRINTSLEVKNTPQNLVWLDQDRLATIATSLTIYDSKSQKSETISGLTNMKIILFLGS